MNKICHIFSQFACQLTYTTPWLFAILKLRVLNVKGAKIASTSFLEKTIEHCIRSKVESITKNIETRQNSWKVEKGCEN